MHMSQIYYERISMLTHFADDLQKEIDKRIPKYNIHDRLGTRSIEGAFKKVLDCSPGSKEENESLIY